MKIANDRFLKRILSQTYFLSPRTMIKLLNGDNIVGYLDTISYRYFLLKNKKKGYTVIPKEDVQSIIIGDVEYHYVNELSIDSYSVFYKIK